MNESLFAVLTALLVSTWIWKGLGVATSSRKIRTPMRFVFFAVVIVLAGSLDLPLLRWFTFSMVLGCAWLPHQQRKLWIWVSIILWFTAHYLELLMAGYHGFGFVWKPYILLALFPTVMLSFKNSSLWFLCVGVFLYLSIGIWSW